MPETDILTLNSTFLYFKILNTNIMRKVLAYH